MKKEVRILGISDGLCHGSLLLPRSVEAVGVVFRGAYWLEGVMRTSIRRNGWNATSQLIKMIRSSPHFQQTRLIITDGLALAGLNILNIKTLHEKTGIPIIAVSRGRGEVERLSRAIKGPDRYNLRRRALKVAGKAMHIPLASAGRPLYVHYTGMDAVEVKNIMKAVCMKHVPEPIRVARIFSSAFNQFVTGQRFQKD